MDVEKQREVVRLWNRMRQVEGPLAEEIRIQILQCFAESECVPDTRLEQRRARVLRKPVQKFPDNVRVAITDIDPLREVADKRGRVSLLRLQRQRQVAMLPEPLDSALDASRNHVFAKTRYKLVADFERQSM